MSLRLAIQPVDRLEQKLANGWFYSIVTRKIENFDGAYYEGSGIPPEIYIKNTPSDMSAGLTGL